MATTPQVQVGATAGGNPPVGYAQGVSNPPNGGAVTSVDPPQPMVPMISPDGRSGDIPANRVGDAQKAGFKAAYAMTSPDGQTGYVPDDQYQNAVAKGFKLNTQPGVRVTGTNGAGQPMFGPEAQPSTASLYAQALFNPVGSSAHPQGVVGGAEQVGGRAMQTALSPLLHPIQTVEALGRMGADAFSHSVDPNNPIFQRAMEYAMENQLSPALANENLAGDVLGTVEGGRLTDAAMRGVQPSPSLGPLNSALPDIVQNGVGRTAAQNAADLAQQLKMWARPTSDPSILPRSEFAARRLAQAILPATKDATNFIKAASEETPNILQYAKETGNPLNTRLEFSKAAQGYAQQVRSFYEQNILGPNADKSVDTTGAGFGNELNGKTHATLRQIDRRIVQINKQLDTPALNADDARRALASRASLQHEVRTLTRILQNNLADATALTPDQIGDVRQRVGRSYELANDTNAAVTQTMQGEGRDALKDLGPWKSAAHVANKLRGGPNAIADRAFQRAITQFPGRASSLPIPGDPVPPPPAPQVTQRVPLWQQAGTIPTQPPTIFDASPDLGNLEALQRRFQQRVTANQQFAESNRLTQEALQRAYQEAADANRAAALQEATRLHESQNMAQDLSAQRAQRAANLRQMRKASEDAFNKLQGESMRDLIRKRRTGNQ